MDNNMADKIKAMLEDPETLNTISAVMKSMQGQGIPEPQPSGDNFASDDDAENSSASRLPEQDMMANMGKIMSQLNSTEDPRINLLNSLKPYMGKNRSAKMEQAIKLIQISKMASVLKL